MIASSLAWLLSLAIVGAEEGVARVDLLKGVVVGLDARPISDVEVVAASGGRDGQPCVTLGRSRTDVEGRFTLKLVEEISNCDRPTLWTVAEDRVVGSCAIDPRAVDGEPIRVTLTSSGGVSFVVAGPDGRPIAGARVIPRAIARESSLIPEAVAALALGVTDREGRAVLDGFRAEELLSVSVEAAGFGVQVREVRTADGLADVGTRGIALQGSGRVTGRVVADDPKAVEGLTVLVTSSGLRGGANHGLAEARTDAQGHFSVEAIASGALTIRVQPRTGSPDLPTRVIRRNLEVGKSLDVEIPLRRGVRVTGLAVDARDARPISGVAVSVVSAGSIEPSRVLTDDQGRYDAFVPAGLVSHRVLKVPSPYLCPPRFFGPRPVEVPPAIARFELPTIPLQGGGELQGRVVDSKDRGVAGAKVEASWMLVEGRVRSPRSEMTMTRADGSFLLRPVASDCELTLTATVGEASTEQAVQARASDPKLVVLRVVEPDGAIASGLVRSPDGRGVAGASVRIWSIRRTPGGSVEATSLVRFDDSDEILTDDEGRFVTPEPLRRDREYRAFASAEGYNPSQTRAIHSSDDGPTTFPDLVLDRDGRRVALEGRVMDRQGQPLEGVALRTSLDGPCCRRGTTDAAGRFRLEGVAEGGLFLFAEKDGFRFLGRSIESSGGLIEITLTRLDEPSSTSMTTRLIPPTGLGLARRILVPYAEKVLTEGDQATRLRTLELLAKVDPKRVLKLIDAKVVADAWLADHLRHSASCSPSTEALGERKAVVKAIQDPEWRVVAGLAAAEDLPETSKVLRREWVDEALEDARLIGDPARRVVALARVADRWVDLGERDRATRLLEEARPIAESLPTATSGGRARVEFAQVLARVDPGAALALTEALVDPGEFDRCRVEIARHLASTDPARAARVLESLRDPRGISEAIPGLCHALAPIDPAQARRLLARVRDDEPCLAPYALGLMALAVADLDKPKATTWLREAFDGLAKVAHGSASSQSPRDPAAVAASLLPIAEKVDPTLVPELFWRAVSLRTPRASTEIRLDAVLALLLARYDREVSRALFEPLADRALASASSEAELAPLIVTLAILDPFRAVRLIEGLPEPLDLTFHQVKNEARLTLAAALLRGAPACWDDAVRRFLHLSPD